jgi:hypothetical protein
MPKLPLWEAVICTILNCFVAGLGTMVSACVPDIYGNYQIKNRQVTQIFIGLMMFLTSVYIVGYVFSFYWAYLIILKALGRS